jgi:rhodanese-related sulfurtransferase
MTTTAARLVDDAEQAIASVSPNRLEVHLYAGTAQVIDVREPEELAEQGWIAESVHVPRGLLEFRADPTDPSFLPELAPTDTTVVYCGAGGRSALAAQALLDLGWSDAVRLDGGIHAWKRAGRPVVGLAP